MDLTTTYLGMKLRTPLVPSASPFSEEMDKIKKMAVAASITINERSQKNSDQSAFELAQYIRGLATYTLLFQCDDKPQRSQFSGRAL